MDLRKDGWHSLTKISGVGTPIVLSGSLMQMFGQLLQHFNAVSPRQLADGKYITIKISDKPIPITDESVDETALHLEAMIDPRLIQSESPMEGEDIVEFIKRLERLGFPEPTAAFIARDAFGYPVDSDITQWINDPQAQLFRQMNASDRAYESCDKEEYGLLKRTLAASYPDFIKAMRLRE